MSTMTCRCGRPTSGAVLCDRCAFRTLPTALANIAAYNADLDTIRARLHAVRYDLPRGKGGRKEMPLPVDLRFADRANLPDGELDESGWPRHRLGQGTAVSDDARNTVTTWTRAVLEEWPPFEPLVCDDGLCRRCNPLRAEASIRRHPEDSITSCCAYLVRMLRHIAGAEWAPQLLEELLHLEHRLRSFVDVPPSRWYAGPCTAGQDSLEWAALCGADLYAVLDRDEVTCRECGWSYSITERRAWLLAAAEDRWEITSVIARAVAVLGDYEHAEAKLAQRIRQWSRRNRLRVRDTVEMKGKLRPRYRLGDVLDLVAEDTRDDTLRRAAGR